MGDGGILFKKVGADIEMENIIIVSVGDEGPLSEAVAALTVFGISLCTSHRSLILPTRFCKRP